MNKIKSKVSARRLVPIIVIVMVACAGAYLLGDILNFETLRDNREILIEWRDSNYILAVLLFILTYTVVVAFSLPGALILSLIGGFLFAIFPGTLYTVLAATIGATTIFLAVKLGLGDYLHTKFFSHSEGDQETLLDKMDREIHKNEISYLFLMRLIPVIPFFIANLAPAFLGVSLRNYVFTTFFGILPGSLVYTSVGAGLGDVFAAGEVPNLGIIFEWHILGPILGLCFLAVMPIILSKFRTEGENE